MSGGQQQMLAVVRSYLCSPDLILIDEVSMGLAPLVVDEIFEFISELSARGTSMLLVEQYVARVLAIASDVYMLNQGSNHPELPPPKRLAEETSSTTTCPRGVPAG